MKTLTILGARPQFIKAGAVSRVFKEKGIEEIILHTGQHFDHGMSDVFFEELEIPKPHINLNINSLSHGAMTGRMLEGIEKAILEHSPDWVMVYGDTNSTIAGALAAKKLHVKLAHVEAGLRSYNMAMPEEINRILTDRISDILFCPTQTAVNNLTKEGFENFDCQIENVGDVMYDAVLHYKNKAFAPEAKIPEQFALLTLHRAENTDNKERLNSIFAALNKISETLPIVFPVHPRTKKVIENLGIKTSKNIFLINPVSYFQMLYLLDHCKIVLTDSGGLQKEAYFFSKSCLTLRDETEWVELVHAGYNFLVGADTKIISEKFHQALNLNGSFSERLYGDGKAGERIVEELLNS